MQLNKIIHLTIFSQGPPVKDIKREAPRAVYQHSSKARDWSNLGGDLEAVFGGGAGPSQTEKGTQGAGTREGEQDEWGEFAGFCPTSPAPLPKQSHQVDVSGSFNASTNMNTISASNHNIPAPAFANPATSSVSNVVPPSASFSLPPSSSVGCRLASLAESPVHRYAFIKSFYIVQFTVQLCQVQTTSKRHLFSVSALLLA